MRSQTIRRSTVVLMAALLAVGGNPLAHADTKSELEHAKSRLASLVRDMSAKRSRLADLQAGLDQITGRIERAQSRLAETQSRIAATTQAIRDAQRDYYRLKIRLESRARLAYEQGPSGLLSIVFDSSTMTDLSDRLAFASNLAQDDADLANAVANRAAALSYHEQDLRRLQRQQAAGLADLRKQERALAAKFDEQQKIVDQLGAEQKELTGLIGQLQGKLRSEELARARAATVAAGQASTGHVGSSQTGGTVSGSPFQVCPVGSPHSYVDSFGAPRVGHVHAGNDIMAPVGTPIYAPFSGRASSSSGGLGGIEVYVYGSEGYVFNAHLSRVGQLGSVSAGTVVGYVGATGNAAGGAPHDHFEWHPRSIPANPYRSPYGYTVISGAIDPYPYLNQVC